MYIAPKLIVYALKQVYFVILANFCCKIGYFWTLNYYLNLCLKKQQPNILILIINLFIALEFSLENALKIHRWCQNAQKFPIFHNIVEFRGRCHGNGPSFSGVAVCQKNGDNVDLSEMK